MKNKYQETFSAIRPSDEAIERVMNMTNNENKKRIKIAPIVAMVACLAIFVTGLFAGGVFKQEPNVIDKTPVVTEKEKTDFKDRTGFVMVAYADEMEELEIVEDINNLEPSTPFICQIGAVDIKGKSQKETDEIVQEIRDKYQYVEGEYEIGKVHFCMSTNTDIYNDAVIYEAYCGNFNFDIDAETVKNVKEIRVTNNNKEYGCVVITANDVWYNDDLTLKNDGIDYNKSVYLSNAYDKFVALSGERYKKCYELGEDFGGIKAYFGVSWTINDGLYKALNENPNFDLSQIKDTITFEVEFNDGTISKSVIDIAFSKDGKMHAVGGSYDFVDANKS